MDIMKVLMLGYRDYPLLYTEHLAHTRAYYVYARLLLLCTPLFMYLLIYALWLVGYYMWLSTTTLYEDLQSS